MKLKNLILLFVFLFFAVISVIAQTNPNHVRVRGYYKSDGTYVRPHYRTAPNHTNRDNFSTIGNINPYTGQKGWIKPDNNAINIMYSGWNTTYSSESVKKCTSANCTQNSLIYSSGYMHKLSKYCISHTPKCINPTCSNPKLINYYGTTYLDFCDEHEHTCKIDLCYNIARVDNSEYLRKQTNYCNSHTPVCKNPYCSEFSKINFYGSNYEKYCKEHTHTCKIDLCYNIARVDNSGYLSKQTNYCNSHTPVCKNPYCSEFAKINFYGSNYEKYCKEHTHTCKIDLCYNIARVDNSGYLSKQTNYCNSHTPVCKSPYCSEFAKINFYGSGYENYCKEHTHTCKIGQCYNIARVDNSGYQSKQTNYCSSHTPVCQFPNCKNFSIVRYYGSGYRKYCKEHTE